MLRAAFALLAAPIWPALVLAEDPPPLAPANSALEQLLPFPQPAAEPPVESTAPAVTPSALADGFDALEAAGSMGRMGGLAGLGMTGPNGPAVLSFTDRTNWYPSQHVAGQAADLGFVRQAIGLTVPLYRDGLNTISFNSNVQAIMFQTDASLPMSGRPFPDTIWGIHFGWNYSYQFANGWFGLLGVTFGSSGDKPFDAWRDVNFGINGMMRVPQGENNAWLFSIAYSPLGQLGFPIPGIAFQWHPNDWLQMNIGIPFQITLMPTPDWTITASYMLLTNIHAQVAYRVAPRMRLYGGFDWNNEGYQLSDRVNDRDRFFYYEKRLVVGVRSAWRQFQFDVSGGYAFDRYYAEGRVFGNHDRVDIGSGPFLGLSARYRW